MFTALLKEYLLTPGTRAHPIPPLTSDRTNQEGILEEKLSEKLYCF